MKENYRKLGDIVELIDERNKDGKVQNLIGVSIDKCFIKSVANTIGTDLTKYQVIRKNDFACSLMQVSRDGKIPIACLKDYNEAIMSPAYYIFRIKNTNEVLPDYLAMWFMRTEFDREASYIAVGGVRGSMPWEDFCDMKLPVPDLKEQEKIVNTYNSITRRINLLHRINDKLEETVQCLYRNLFLEGKEKNSTLADIYNFQYGKGNNNPDNGGQYPIYGSNGIIGGYTEYNAENIPVIGHIGSCGSLCFGFGKIYVTYNGIMCIIKNENYKFFGYFTLKSLNLLEQVRGSTQPFISYDMLYEMKLYLPIDKEVSYFENNAKKIMVSYEENLREIQKLEELKQLVISRISGNVI